MHLTYNSWQATATTNPKSGGLAPREAQHLIALASGLSAKEIAREFNVSVSTVRHSLRRVYDRLRVDRATAAVAQAIRRGWIAPLLLALLFGSLSPTTDALRVRQPTRTRQQVSTNARVGRRDTGSAFA